MHSNENYFKGMVSAINIENVRQGKLFFIKHILIQAEFEDRKQTVYNVGNLNNVK